ncbi:MAG: PaaI family thioesterase [Pseudomonadota bacterium]
MSQTPRNPDYETIVRESFARQGFLMSMGARLNDVAPGRVVIALQRSQHVTQQQGYFHGAVIGAIADSAAGYAALSVMEPNSEVVTVEYKINFVAPAKGTRLVAVGAVLRSGRTLTVGQSDVFAEDVSGAQTRVALMQATFSRVALKT